MIKFLVPWEWLVLKANDSLDIDIVAVNLPEMDASIRDAFMLVGVPSQIEWGFVGDSFEMIWNVFVVFDDEASASVFKLACM